MNNWYKITEHDGINLNDLDSYIFHVDTKDEEYGTRCNLVVDLKFKSECSSQILIDTKKVMNELEVEAFRSKEKNHVLALEKALKTNGTNGVNILG